MWKKFWLEPNEQNQKRNNSNNETVDAFLPSGFNELMWFFHSWSSNSNLNALCWSCVKSKTSETVPPFSSFDIWGMTSCEKIKRFAHVYLFWRNTYLRLQTTLTFFWRFVRRIAQEEYFFSGWVRPRQNSFLIDATQCSYRSKYLYHIGTAAE